MTERLQALKHSPCGFTAGLDQGVFSIYNRFTDDGRAVSCRRSQSRVGKFFSGLCWEHAWFPPAVKVSHRRTKYY